MRPRLGWTGVSGGDVDFPKGDNNLGSLEVGAMICAPEDSGGNFSDAIDDTNAHVNFLYPACVGELKTRRPGAAHRFRAEYELPHPSTGLAKLFELSGQAGSRINYGASCELFGFMNVHSGSRNFTVVRIGNRSNYVLRGAKKSVSGATLHPHFGCLLPPRNRNRTVSNLADTPSRG
jgi:hypothetical protein